MIRFILFHSHSLIILLLFHDPSTNKSEWIGWISWFWKLHIKLIELSLKISVLDTRVESVMINSVEVGFVDDEVYCRNTNEDSYIWHM
jgi:hypothetical protein